MSARPRPGPARSPAKPESPFRRLARPWLSPGVFDFWASRLHPTWSWERPLARIVERRAESADAVTLVLRPNRHWGGCRPGQHLNLSAEIDGSRVTRSYSPTGLPGRDRRIAITVKAVEGGKLSRYLCERARVGDVLDLGPAFGDMQLDEAAPVARLLLAAGSGITPMIAFVRALAARGMPAPLSLLYWARKREQLCFVDELRGYAAAHPQFQLRFLLTGEAAQAADAGRSGPARGLRLRPRRLRRPGARPARRPRALVPGRGLQPAAAHAGDWGHGRNHPGRERAQLHRRARAVPAERAGSAGPQARLRLPHGYLQHLRLRQALGQHPSSAHRRRPARTGLRAAPVREHRHQRPRPRSVTPP